MQIIYEQGKVGSEMQAHTTQPPSQCDLNGVLTDAPEAPRSNRTDRCNPITMRFNRASSDGLRVLHRYFVLSGELEVSKKMLNFALQMMEFALNMMDFVLKMMEFALNMMDFVLKMMNIGR